MRDIMDNPDLFEEMLATYPAEKRELAREVYYRFADGDSTQFFSQLFLVLDVYSHYAERIPARLISANADSIATVQELRDEIGRLAKILEVCNDNVTNHAQSTDELCRATLAKCNETIAAIGLAVKNIGAQVDTKAIAQEVNSALESRIKDGIIGPFIRHAEALSLYVFPTLKSIRESADEAKSFWSKRIWRTAWTTCILWSVFASVILIALIDFKLSHSHEDKVAAQIAKTTQVMDFNQEAFRQLAIAQIPIRVLRTESNGIANPRNFALVVENADSADIRPEDGRKDGLVFFTSPLSEKQIQWLQQETARLASATNDAAK